MQSEMSYIIKYTKKTIYPQYGFSSIYKNYLNHFSVIELLDSSPPPSINSIMKNYEFTWRYSEIREMILIDFIY